MGGCQATTQTATMGAGAVWLPPPAAYVIEDDGVHVWRACLDVSPAVHDALQPTLSADEHARAARFHTRHDRARFVVARGYLRVLLGHYLARPPSHLRFTANAHGKPALLPEHHDRLPHFSVSHSRALALYAITGRGPVGVDLEYIQPDFPCDEIAARFFSPREIATLRALPPAGQQAAFFAAWTRKEAYIKARGVGLSLPLSGFDVSLAPGEPAALLRVHGAADEAARWPLHDLSPHPDYAAAVAVEGHDCRVICYANPPVRAAPHPPVVHP